jgi:hypothetical protein
MKDRLVERELRGKPHECALIPRAKLLVEILVSSTSGEPLGVGPRFRRRCFLVDLPPGLICTAQIFLLLV